MLDFDGSVHLETNGQTFISLLQSLGTLASNSPIEMREWTMVPQSYYIIVVCDDDVRPKTLRSYH
jgi:hypothetical protein